MVLISFKTAKTKKHIANFRFSYQIHFVVHYVDYLSEDITQRLIMFLASKSLRLPISSERNRHSSERNGKCIFPLKGSVLVTYRVTVGLKFIYLSIYLRILPTPSQAFLAGTARQGHEKKKVKSMIVSLFQDDRLKLDR